MFAEEEAATESPVTSQTVGFSTISVPRGAYKMAAIQFSECNSDEDAQNIAKSITTDLPVYDYGTDWDTPDFPVIWVKTSDINPSYDKQYYYCEDTDVGLAPGWYRNAEFPIGKDDLVDLGRGFWIIVPNDEELYPNASYTVQFKGQVADMTQGISVPVCDNCYIMAASAFPSALDISKIVCSEGIPALDYGGDYDTPDFPVIWVKTSDINPSYDKQYYYCEDTEADLKPGWYRNAEYPITQADFIQPGNAFWIIIPDDTLTADNQTMTFYP